MKNPLTNHLHLPRPRGLNLQRTTTVTLTGILLAFRVSCTHHVVGDATGTVTHILAVLTRQDRHFHFHQGGSGWLPLVQPSPARNDTALPSVVSIVLEKKGDF